MKKRFLIITIVVLVIIALIALGFIIGNLLQKEPSNSVQNNTIDEGSSGNDQPEGPTENKGTNVVLNSKVGTQILSKFYMPNIYAESYFQELDANGLSDKAKLLYTYVQISKREEYSNYLRMKEDYSGSYITLKDMETILAKYFTNTNNIKHQAVFGEQSYNSEDKTYIIVPIGFAGNTMRYIVEIPDQIIEYSDRIEVEFYRIYAINEVQDEQQDEMVANFYYDANRTSLAFQTQDEHAVDEQEQISYLTQKINQGDLNKSVMQKVKYTLIKKGNDYQIDKVEKI